MPNKYYTLIGSLPHLPYFDKTSRLPINAERLQKRLGMLQPVDAEVVETVQTFLLWQYHSMDKTNSDIIRHYSETMALVTQPSVRNIIDYRMNIRTIVSALRRRYYNHPAPTKQERWGIGQWCRQIIDHWNDPDFGLGAIHPWISQAQQLIAQEETLEFERLLMGLIWDNLDRHEVDDPFGLDSLLVYLFKWDIIKRWQIYNREKAADRFDKLVDKALNNYVTN
jgi:hypothetical protein